MAQVKKNNQFLSRAVLLAAYVLLFAVQGNYRFYTVANFFDYHSGSRVTKATALPSHFTTHNSTHLGMDKRFSAKLLYKLPDNTCSPVVSAETIERKYALLLKVYAASDLPTNALRGPPIV
jgi:hypothetical protein